MINLERDFQEQGNDRGALLKNARQAWRKHHFFFDG